MSYSRTYFYLGILALLLAMPGYARDKSNDEALQKGTQLTNEKKYGEAIEVFEQILKDDPNSISAYIEMARSLVLQGKRKEGIKKLDAAEAIAKKKTDIKKLKEQRRLLSEIFYTNSTFQRYQDGLNDMKGMKFRAAIEAFEQALATEPDNVEVMVAYARAMQSVDDWKESVNVLEQAFQLNPDKLEARVLLAAAQLNNNHEKTIQLLKPIVGDKNISEEAIVLYAQALAKQNDMDGAVSFLQKQVEHNSERLRALFWLGKFSSDMPDNRWMARKHLQTFLKRSERLKDSEDWKNLQNEAERIVERIDGDLEIEKTKEGSKQ